MQLVTCVSLDRTLHELIATLICEQVRGDVFVARVFDNEDEFKRLDFTLSEVSSSADWIKEAATQNERKRKVCTA